VRAVVEDSADDVLHPGAVADEREDGNEDVVVLEVGFESGGPAHVAASQATRAAAAWERAVHLEDVDAGAAASRRAGSLILFYPASPSGRD
jgi:hypothetical protein